MASRRFPILASQIGIVLSLLAFVIGILVTVRHAKAGEGDRISGLPPGFQDAGALAGGRSGSRVPLGDHAAPSMRKGIGPIAWIILLPVCIWFAGFLMGASLFVAAFLIFEARVSARFALVGGAATFAVLLALGRAFQVPWPSYLLQNVY